jgi:hypothetical protein
MAESKVVQLKYADPEDPSERLNAMFNSREPYIRGHQRWATTRWSSHERRGQRRLLRAGAAATRAANPATPVVVPGRPGTGQQPLSNVIGHVRFIPIRWQSPSWFCRRRSSRDIERRFAP